MTVKQKKMKKEEYVREKGERSNVEGNERWIEEAMGRGVANEYQNIYIPHRLSLDKLGGFGRCNPERLGTLQRHKPSVFPISPNK